MPQFKMTVTSKGQVTLPAEYRRLAGIETGAQLTMVVDDRGEARLRPARDLDAFIGSLSDAKLVRPLRQADIDAAVDEAVDARLGRAKARRGS